MVEYDKISVPGIIYLSFTETKINDVADDLKESLANADKVAIWKINAPDKINLLIGETLDLSFTISKDGIIQEINERPDFILGEGLVINESGDIVALQECETTLMLSYKNALHTILISICDKKPSVFISGDDYIRVTRKAKYIFTTNEELGDLEFSIDDDKKNLASIEVEGNTCIVKANNKNKVGKLVLSVKHNNQIYEKEITVEFVSFIRNEKHFESVDKLKEQLLLDIEFAKNNL